MLTQEDVNLLSEGLFDYDGNVKDGTMRSHFRELIAILKRIPVQERDSEAEYMKNIDDTLEAWKKMNWEEIANF